MRTVFVRNFSCEYVNAIDLHLHAFLQSIRSMSNRVHNHQRRLQVHKRQQHLCDTERFNVQNQNERKIHLHFIA